MYIVKSAQNTNIRICSLCRRSAANTQYLHYNHNAILTCASILTKSLAILPLVGRHVCKRSIYFHNKCCLLRHSDYHVICGTEIYTHIYAYTLRSSIHVVNPLWMIKTSAKIIIKWNNRENERKDGECNAAQCSMLNAQLWLDSNL